MCAFRHEDEIAAEYEVRPSAERPSLELSDDRLRTLPDLHEAADVVSHHLVIAHGIPRALAMRDARRVVGVRTKTRIAFTEVQVVAGRERAAGATQDDAPCAL